MIFGILDCGFCPHVTEELTDGLDVPQVVVLAAGDNDFGCAALAELLDDEGAKEAGAPRDDDAFVTPEGVAVGPSGVRYYVFPRCILGIER